MKNLFFFIVVLGSLVAVSDEAEACTCAALPSVKEALQTSDAVFAGKIVKIEPKAVTFEVSFRWKGPAVKTIVLVMDETSCRYPFHRVGEKYLVYARQGVGGLTTSVCTRTNLLISVEKDLLQLGPPR